MAMENVTTLALSRLVAQSRALEVTATNLANTNTPGFRASRTIFTDFLARQPGGQALAYTQDRATYRDASAGERTHTGNKLDIALGNTTGWLTVQTAAGPRLTRAGHFELNGDGTVVDEAGNPLLDSNGGKLQTAPTDINLTITADGTLSGANGPIGRIGVVAPQNAAQMQAEGAHLFAATTPTAPVADPHVIQGSLEQSNVQPIQELARMMDDEREFQFTTQMIQAESDRQNGALEKIMAKQGQ